jgi:cell division protein FtsB
MRRLARLAVAFTVLLAVLFVAGFPARTYLDQRHALATTQDRLKVLRTSNDALSKRADELHSDAAVEKLAREQYSLVRPGEEAYAILPGPAAPEAPKPAPAPVKKQTTVAKILDTLSFWN